MDSPPGASRERREKGSREVSNTTGVDAAILAQVAGKFDQKTGEINDQLKFITDTVERTRPYWQGTAGLGFQNVGSLWGEQQTRIIRLLGEMAEAIRSAGTGFTAGNQEAAQAVSVPMDLPLENKRRE